MLASVSGKALFKCTFDTCEQNFLTDPKTFQVVNINIISLWTVAPKYQYWNWEWRNPAAATGDASLRSDAAGWPINWAASILYPDFSRHHPFYAGQWHSVWRGLMQLPWWPVKIVTITLHCGRQGGHADFSCVLWSSNSIQLLIVYTDL